MIDEEYKCDWSKGRARVFKKSRIDQAEINKKKNRIVTVAMCSGDDYGSWMRHLRHLGFDTTAIAERPLTDEEKEVNMKTWRLHHYAYSNWIAFCEDEWEVTHNREWIEKLITLSGQKIDIDKVMLYKKEGAVMQTSLFNEEVD